MVILKKRMGFCYLFWNKCKYNPLITDIIKNIFKEKKYKHNLNYINLLI